MRSGTIQLRLPPDVWIDLEHAANSIDEAEGALRGGDARGPGAMRWRSSSSRGARFCPARRRSWIEARRTRLRSLLVRGLHILSQITAINGEHALAVQYATEIIDLEPFQETGYRHLMQMHAEMGNRGEALRVFGKCRELFRGGARRGSLAGDRARVSRNSTSGAVGTARYSTIACITAL